MRLEEDRVVWRARDKLNLAIALTFVTLKGELLVPSHDGAVRSGATSYVTIHRDGKWPQRQTSNNGGEQENCQQGKLLSCFIRRKHVHRSPRMCDSWKLYKAQFVKFVAVFYSHEFHSAPEPQPKI